MATYPTCPACPRAGPAAPALVEASPAACPVPLVASWLQVVALPGYGLRVLCQPQLCWLQTPPQGTTRAAVKPLCKWHGQGAHLAAGAGVAEPKSHCSRGDGLGRGGQVGEGLPYEPCHCRVPRPKEWHRHGPGAWVMLSSFTCWYPRPRCMCWATRTWCWSHACWICLAGIPGWPWPCCTCWAWGTGATRAGSIQGSPAREPRSREQ